MSYNPNQPRVPAGKSTGGQWTSDGSGAAGSAREAAGLSKYGIKMPDGLDSDRVDAINGAYEIVAERNPELAKLLLNEVVFLEEDDYAAARSFSNGKIGINPNNGTLGESSTKARDVDKMLTRWKNSLEGYEDIYKTTGDEKWMIQINFLKARISNYSGLDFVRGAAVGDQTEVMIHEMGHELRSLLTEHGFNGSTDFWEFLPPPELRAFVGPSYVYEETMYWKLNKWSRSKIGLSISEYATTNDNEFWAESFATWVLGQDQTKYIPKDVTDVFERAMDYKW